MGDPSDTGEGSPIDGDFGRTAYEARFSHCRVADPERGINGEILPWSHLPPEARAVWARVERAVLVRFCLGADPGDPFKRIPLGRPGEGSDGSVRVAEQLSP